jgi:putative ABC transport system ATP-binding protein
MQVRDVSRRYDDGAVQALRHVSLDVRGGEYIAIMGPSGSGKSTLLNLMGALDLPDQGEILFRGQSLARMDNLDQFRARHPCSRDRCRHASVVSGPDTCWSWWG